MWQRVANLTVTDRYSKSACCAALCQSRLASCKGVASVRNGQRWARQVVSETTARGRGHALSCMLTCHDIQPNSRRRTLKQAWSCGLHPAIYVYTIHTWCDGQACACQHQSKQGAGHHSGSWALNLPFTDDSRYHPLDCTVCSGSGAVPFDSDQPPCDHDRK